MCRRIKRGKWLGYSQVVRVKPFLVSDATFPLEATCLKCFDLAQNPRACNFKYSLIRTYRDVTFGRLKGCWRIMDGRCETSDHVFARMITVVCYALHSICERH